MNENDFLKSMSELKDYIHKEFTSFNHKIDKLIGKIENHNHRIVKLEEKHDKIENKVDKKIYKLESDVDEIKKRFYIAMGIFAVLITIGEIVLRKLV